MAKFEKRYRFKIDTRKRKFTRQDAGLTQYQTICMIADGTLREVGTVGTGKRGRPAKLYEKVTASVDSH